LGKYSILINEYSTKGEHFYRTADTITKIGGLSMHKITHNNQLNTFTEHQYIFIVESANAIKIHIWVTLTANLLMTLLQKSLTRSWSFSGLATMVRIVLMYYIKGASNNYLAMIF
jgi:hypothetical protein